MSNKIIEFKFEGGNKGSINVESFQGTTEISEDRTELRVNGDVYIIEEPQEEVLKKIKKTKKTTERRTVPTVRFY